MSARMSAIDSPLVKLIIGIWLLVLALKTFYNLKVSICYFCVWVAPPHHCSIAILHTSCLSNTNWSILINKLCQLIYDLTAITVTTLSSLKIRTISSNGTHHTRKQKKAKAIPVKMIETRKLTFGIEIYQRYMLNVIEEHHTYNISRPSLANQTRTSHVSSFCSPPS